MFFNFIKTLFFPALRASVGWRGSFRRCVVGFGAGVGVFTGAGACEFAAVSALPVRSLAGAGDGCGVSPPV